MPINEWRTGTTYLQVRAGRGGWALDVVKATQRRPQSVAAGCVVVKIELQMPRAAFEPLQPSAVVVVPEELVQRPVRVDAIEAARAIEEVGG